MKAEILHFYYEKLCWLIISEALSLAGLIILLSRQWGEFGNIFWLEVFVLFQLPALKFIKDDVVETRPELKSKLVKVTLGFIVGLLVLSALIFLFWLDWRNTLIAIIVSLFVGLLLMFFGEKIKEKFFSFLRNQVKKDHKKRTK